MDTAVDPNATGICAKPGCDNVILLDESCYVDGCGFICAECHGPLPDWWFDIEPPY
jgi:hypothetical protein